MRTQDIRKLCTDIEHKLLQSAAAKNIAKLDSAKARAALKKVEALVTRLKAQAKKAIKAKATGAKAKARAFEDAAKRLRGRLVKLERAAVAKVKAARKPAKRTKAAKAPAKKKPVAAAKRRSTASAVMPAAVRNPLTHRGTRASRTQLLMEHQGVPVEPAPATAQAAGAAPTESVNLSELIRETEVRNQTLKTRSARARGKSVENLLAASANARIRGHASGAGRRAQGRRDAAQRGEKRPGSAD